jgi:hypothetical protein
VENGDANPAIGARALAQPPDSDFMCCRLRAGHVHEITAAYFTASDERRAVKTLWFFSSHRKEWPSEQ